MALRPNLFVTVYTNTLYFQMETNGTPTSPGGEVPSDTTDKYTR